MFLQFSQNDVRIIPILPLTVRNNFNAFSMWPYLALLSHCTRMCSLSSESRVGEASAHRGHPPHWLRFAYLNLEWI